MGKTERIGVRTMSGRKSLELNNALISVIGDEDTVTGMLLAGVGNVDARRTSNFLVVDAKTSPAQIEEAFQRFTKRNDIAVIIINQYIASMIRPAIDAFEGTSPAILESTSRSTARARGCTWRTRCSSSRRGSASAAPASCPGP